MRSKVTSVAQVVELSGMTPDSFCCFLHHNVPPFYTDIHEFSRLADAFSEADLMLRYHNRPNDNANSISAL